MSPPSETPYLSYYDIRLTKEDVRSLKNDWLRDNVIAFWEEYLEREYLVEYKNSRIVLLQPPLVQLLKEEQNPQQLAGVLPDFTNVTHIFLPVNDARTTSADRGEHGSHWSLLLVSVVDGVAFHYDSLNCNENEAYYVSQKLQALLNVRIRFIHLNDTPQQENSTDCGVFVCLIMKHLLLKRLLMVRTDEKVSMSMANKRIDAREGRKEMMRIIEERRKEGERRRSASNTRSPTPLSRPRPGTPPRIGEPSPLGSRSE